MSKSNTNNPVDSVMSPEDIVIGCMMASENAARYISANCNCDDFQSGENRTIFMRFQVICNLVDKGVYPHATTDVLSIWFNESNNGPFKRALKLKEQVQHPDDYISYTALFKEARTKQRFMTEMQSVLKRATEPDYPYIENACSLLSALESEQTIYRKPPEGLTIETVKASLAQTGEMGVITGFDTFDDICKGLRPKCLYVLGGLPSSGKSTLAENMAVRAARQGNIVAYLSYEMSKNEVIQRAIRSIAPCDEEALSCHNSGSIHSIKIEKAIQDVGNLSNLYIDYSCTKDVDTICAYCKLIKSANGGRLDLIVIDHAQIVPPPKHLSKSDLRLQINYLSRRLKQFAMQEDTAVLLLSQLNRKASERDLPVLSDLKESGSLEQDADVVAFLTRLSGTSNDAIVRIAKNRSGPNRDIAMHMFPEYFLFKEVRNNKVT